MSDLTHIQQIYGHTDLYSILSIPRNASSTQIREAYFCLRYDIYQQLSDENTDNGGSKLSAEERKQIEAKMDAITSTFRILTDPGRRIAYDNSLNDDEYIEVEPKEKIGASPNTTRVNRSVFRRKGASKVKPQSGLESSVGSREKPKAETVTSFRKKNVERSIATEESYDSIFGGETASKTPSSLVGSHFSKGSNFDSIFGDESKASKGTKSTLQTNNIGTAYSTEMDDDAISGHNTAHTGQSGVTSDFASFPSNPSAYQEHLPVGVDNLNIREQMLYKNQMYLNSQQKQDQKGTEGKSRISSRYEAKERNDWLNDGEEMTVGEMTLDMRDEATTDDEDETEARSKGKKKRWSLLRKSKVTSPTGVDDFDSFKDSPPKKEKKSYKSSTKSCTKSSKKLSMPKPSTYSFDDDTKTSEYQDDDTRTNDDDTRTYDDDTNYDDETNYDDTTVGDTLEDTTVGESTYASYDDETCASEGPKKYSPGHKKGNRPEPILRSSARNGGKGDEKDDRRVIIHSHRGRKGKGDDEEFANTMCPFPSLTDIKEEVRGTCKDASSAFHQVLHAFVISPDDIDRMSDKIRDAKVELAENYHQQMQERKRASTGGARELSL